MNVQSVKGAWREISIVASLPTIRDSFVVNVMRGLCPMKEAGQNITAGLILATILCSLTNTNVGVVIDLAAS